MPFNYYDTHTLLKSIERVVPATTFLKDRYFPTNDQNDVFATEDVLIEYKEGNKKIAPFVAPRKGGMTILRDGYKAERYTPPNVHPKRPLTIDDLKKKGFGEALYQNLSPDQRQGVFIVRDLNEMRNMVKRREESMSADTIFKNGYVMKHYIDDQGNFEEKEIRFYDEDSNPAIYTPDADWDTTEESGKQIISDIAAMVKLLTSRGLPAAEIIAAPDVADIMSSNAWILKLLDNRKYDIGTAKAEILPSGASKIMTLNIKGRMIDVLSYDETYEDENGSTVQYIPAGYIALGAPKAGRTLYGAVTQLEQTDGEFHTYKGKYVPKYVSDAGRNVREIHLTSCPLVIPNDKNCFITAKVKEV